MSDDATTALLVLAFALWIAAALYLSRPPRRVDVAERIRDHVAPENGGQS
jgi:hypothetical protein